MAYVFAIALFALFLVVLLVPSAMNMYFIAAALGITTTVSAWRSRQRLVVDAERVSVAHRSIAWNNVSYYRYVSVGAAKGSTSLGNWLVDQTRGTNYRTLQIGKLTIYGRDGTTLAIGNAWRKPHDALDLAFAQLHARLDPFARGAVAPFAFLPQAIAHTDGELVYGDIGRVELKQGGVHIFQRDRGLWVREPMRNVHNVLQLLVQFASRGIDVIVDTNVFLPMSILSPAAAIQRSVS